MYEALGSLSENKPEEISKSNAEEPFNEEELMIRASNHYWKMRYRYGKRVFFGWLDTVSKQKSKLKEHFSGGGWKTSTPKEVFNIGAALAKEPKIQKKRLGPFKKKNSKQK